MPGRSTEAPPVSNRQPSSGGGMGLFISAGLHLLLCCALAATLPAIPSPLPSPLMEVDLRERPGARGGSNSFVTQHSRQGAKAVTSTSSLQPTARPDLAPRALEASQTDLRATLAAVTPESNARGAVGEPGTGGGTNAGDGRSSGTGAGQGGVAVDRMPEAVKCEKPVYPAEARRRGITGRVLLRVHVDAVGSVREVLVLSAEPVGVFEAQAVEAVRKWRFTPAVSKGVAVGVRVALPVRFELDDQ
ncbi:MAG: energy transducer TonB [Humidesulfovibrio sp.]|uniref:energy transducer TonB n=1 Tax=Humidesulfovibrio sp. TaxID=2910988 RepID=UPI0027EF1C00|nr:energy transducer TonB [Humidesulfovibrio sp.]MDQ7835553.1 energy transducer TonB [Humidesulfovibrio sp.]